MSCRRRQNVIKWVFDRLRFYLEGMIGSQLMLVPIVSAQLHTIVLKNYKKYQL